MYLKTALSVLALTVLIASLNLGNASQAKDYKDVTLEKFAKMESALNDRQDYKGTIDFLHTYIDENAVLEMKFDNPTLPKAIQGQVIEMSKADYINSFVMGTSNIDQYEITIENRSIEFDVDRKTVRTINTFVESGQVVQISKPSKQPEPFNSITTCLYEHKFENNDLTLIRAECETKVGLMQDI